MRKRRLLLVVAGLAVLLFAAGAVVLWPRPDRITKENFERIHKGMTRTEVEAILGPPGDYRTTPTEPDGLDWIPGLLVSTPWLDVTACWQGDNGEGWVLFSDNAGGALSAEFCEAKWDDEAGSSRLYKVKQRPVDNLLWRAKRQWRKWFP